MVGVLHSLLGVLQAISKDVDGVLLYHLWSIDKTGANATSI